MAAKPKFNPNKPFEEVAASQAQSKPAFDPSQPFESADAPGIGQTVLEQGGNALASGYLPQLQAAAEPVTTAIGNLVTGQDVEPSSYLEVRDAASKRLAAQAQANPKTALASNIGGSLVSAIATPVPGLGAARGIIGGAIKGAAGGALQGAIQNPGDVEGQINPVQAPERLAGAAEGAKFGGVAGGSGEAVRKGLGAIAATPGVLKSAAEKIAFKSSGAMLKDFRQAAAKDEVNELGRFMLDNKLAQAGKTYDDVLEGATKLKQQAGKDLEQVYSKVAKDPAVIANMPGFNPVQDKEKLIALAKTELGDAYDAKEAIKGLSSYLDDLGSKYGDRSIDPKTANEIKGKIDKAINYARNPLTKKPGSETALGSARKYIASRIEASVDFLGKASGDEKLVEKLRDANDRYGKSTRIANIAEDRLQREGTNRMFGLTDTIAGGAGAGLGGLMGDNPEERARGGLIGAAAGALANKAGRKYGPGLMSHSADVASKGLRMSQIPRAAGQGGLLVPQAGLMGRVGTSLKRKENER